MKPGDALLRFLRSVGKPAEVEYYVDLFRKEAAQSFAILQVAGPIDRDLLDVDLRYLEQLGLPPYLADPAEDLAELAVSRAARKVVLLGPWRGLEPAGQPRPSLVDLTTEAEGLRPLLRPEQVALVDQAERIIDRVIGEVGRPVTVAVTSPLQLLRELFTVKGAGTLIRRGSVVTLANDYAGIDRDKLDRVMSSAFGAVPPASFYERPVERIYVAGDYRGAAVVSPSDIGPYLTKFAVDRRAQGEGVGRDLWRAIVSDTGQLHWRCRPDNPIASWYAKQCDGLVRTAEWHVFWRGIEPDQIPQVVDRALSLPRDFR